MLDRETYDALKGKLAPAWEAIASIEATLAEHGEASDRPALTLIQGGQPSGVESD